MELTRAVIIIKMYLIVHYWCMKYWKHNNNVYALDVLDIQTYEETYYHLNSSIWNTYIRK